VELGELQEVEARDLIEQLGHTRIDSESRQRLLTLAGLHPLFLLEIVRDYLAGRLVLPDKGGQVAGIPISIKQILTARARGLSDTAQSISAVLAVAAKPVTLRDLSRLVARTIDATAEGVDELQACRLVAFGGGRVWILHELFRQALYEELTDTRRSVLHLHLAEHLQRSRGDEAAGELAVHFDRAGEASLSALYGWIAGDRAQGRGAMAEASYFFELVIRNEANPARSAEATARLGASLHLARAMNRAAPVLELASTRLRAAGFEVHARRIEVRRVEALAETGDTPVEELLARLKSVKKEARLVGDWEALALALDVELQLLQLDEQLVQVRGVLGQFREIVNEGPIEATAIAHRGLALGLMLEDPEGAVHSAREAVHLTSSLAPEHQFKALNRLLIVLLQQGQLNLPENRSLLLQARDLADRSGDLQQRFSYEGNLGVAALDAGDLDAAEAYFQRAGELIGSADMTFSRINLACNLAELALARGEYHEASECFKAASQHPGLTIPRYTRDLVNAGLGLCALEMGSVGQARMREQALSGPPPIWYYDPTVILTFRARLAELRGGYQDASELLDETCTGLEGRLVMAWLKLRLLHSRLLAKHADARGPGVAFTGLRVAEELNLRFRKKQFARFVGLNK
jgi:Tfp pilus assembly protein PilF